MEERPKTSLVFTYTLIPEDSVSLHTVKRMIHEVANANPEDIPTLFIDLIARMRKLNLEELKDIEKDLRDSENKQLVIDSCLPLPDHDISYL